MRKDTIKHSSRAPNDEYGLALNSRSFSVTRPGVRAGWIANSESSIRCQRQRPQLSRLLRGTRRDSCRRGSPIIIRHKKR